MDLIFKYSFKNGGRTASSFTTFFLDSISSVHPFSAMSEASSMAPLAKYLHELNLTEECKALLPCLPTDRDWLTTALYLYHGFWITSRHLNGLLSAERHFRALDSDVILATIPKSGTTWLKALLFSLVNRSRSLGPCHPLLEENPHELVPFLELHLYVENPTPDLSSFTHPRLFATHSPFTTLPRSVKTSQCKLVYLCRNPKDTFVSLWHFTSKMRLEEMSPVSINDAFDKFCRGVSVYGPYWDHVLEYYKASLELPHRVLFLKYEEMKENPGEHLKRLAKFLECPFSQDEEANGAVDEILRLCSFENLSNLEVNRSGKQRSSGMENRWFFRKGKVGDWVNYLSSEMIERLDQITEEKLRGTGLKI